MTTLLIGIIYLSFISLGLPDSLLGSAWPTMYSEMGSTITGAGTLAMIISACTVVSSLMADRVIHRFGTGKVTTVSVAMTALALFGFSMSGAYWHLVLWCIPYGLGAGSVDSALNNYVALHLKARHMSWLHCMWGVGASIGPIIMAQCLTGGFGWRGGYRTIGTIQMVLTALLVLSLPLWTRESRNSSVDESTRNVLSLGEAVRLPGAKRILIAFLCYCALESSAGLWAASWLVETRGVSPNAAAGYAALFYLGITGGRAVSGFISERLGDTKMIRLGQGIVLLGIAMLLVPGSVMLARAGLVTIGIGCAPIYPSVIHSTPDRFGPENSQSLVGIQMASAYIGSMFGPKVFGLISDALSLGVFPFYLAAITIVMIIMIY